MGEGCGGECSEDPQRYALARPRFFGRPSPRPTYPTPPSLTPDPRPPHPLSAPPASTSTHTTPTARVSLTTSTHPNRARWREFKRPREASPPVTPQSSPGTPVTPSHPNHPRITPQTPPDTLNQLQSPLNTLIHSRYFHTHLITANHPAVTTQSPPSHPRVTSQQVGAEGHQIHESEGGGGGNVEEGSTEDPPLRPKPVQRDASFSNIRVTSREEPPRKLLGTTAPLTPTLTPQHRTAPRHSTLPSNTATD
ncbi:proline-rich receptor-like protein kinase PERK2 [Portunus trituberculatus]|uniref:proline-rich receptor-like protein kinase PERK2 n=1 Tax=Portunus trituberculatus TaxID=210409 RepID=UPI001E1CF403|nr:proline-rich receptor-like protein kinase PERK2 [Portunus trituberculatus]